MINLSLEENLSYRLLTLLVLIVFYGIYFVKLWSQKRRGIQTMQVGRRKELQTHLVETLMGIATVGIVIVQLLSAGCEWSHLPSDARFTGFCIGMIQNPVKRASEGRCPFYRILYRYDR